MNSQLLHRNLLNGNKYNSLIPQSACERVDLGKGNTYTSIELIVKQSLKHHAQVSKLAPVLEKSSLLETTISIHDFLYNHFQYKADESDQNLRSPACSWQQRNDGIDCKSYSIIASAILLQLGIRHYVRMIKQPNYNAQNYTHVYVIVPIDQVNGSLNKGYYTIDGTLKSTNEPKFITKKDYYMDKMQHYGLNGTIPDIKKYDYKELNFNSFAGFFKSLKCFGGTSYNSTRMNDNVNKILNYHFSIIDQYNNSIAAKDFNRTGELIAEYFAKNYALDNAFRQNRNKDWNDCSDSNLVATRKFITEKLAGILGQAMFTHFKENFNYLVKSTYVFRLPRITNDVFDGMNLAHVSTTSEVVSLPFETYTATPKSGNIIGFEITDYLKSQLEAAASETNFDPQQFYTQLQQVGSLITAVGTAGNSGNTDSGQYVYDNENPNNAPQQAGFGTVAAVLGVVGVIGLGVKYFKNK